MHEQTPLARGPYASLQVSATAREWEPRPHAGGALAMRLSRLFHADPARRDPADR